MAEFNVSDTSDETIYTYFCKYCDWNTRIRLKCEKCNIQICNHCIKFKKCSKCLDLIDHIVNFYKHNLNCLTRNELLCLPRCLRKRLIKIIKVKMVQGKNISKELTYQLLDKKTVSRILRTKFNLKKYKNYYKRLGYSVNLDIKYIK